MWLCCVVLGGAVKGNDANTGEGFAGDEETNLLYGAAVTQLPKKGDRSRESHSNKNDNFFATPQ